MKISWKKHTYVQQNLKNLLWKKIYIQKEINKKIQKQAVEKKTNTKKNVFGIIQIISIYSTVKCDTKIADLYSNSVGN